MVKIGLAPVPILVACSVVAAITYDTWSGSVIWDSGESGSGEWDLTGLYNKDYNIFGGRVELIDWYGATSAYVDAYTYTNSYWPDSDGYYDITTHFDFSAEAYLSANEHSKVQMSAAYYWFDNEENEWVQQEWANDGYLPDRNGTVYDHSILFPSRYLYEGEEYRVGQILQTDGWTTGSPPFPPPTYFCEVEGLGHWDSVTIEEAS